MASLKEMLPGDALIAEIKQTCSGQSLVRNLEIAKQLELFNNMYNESLTFGEFVYAYHPGYDPEAKGDPE